MIFKLIGFVVVVILVILAYNKLGAIAGLRPITVDTIKTQMANQTTGQNTVQPNTTTTNTTGDNIGTVLDKKFTVWADMINKSLSGLPSQVIK